MRKANESKYSFSNIELARQRIHVKGLFHNKSLLCGQIKVLHTSAVCCKADQGKGNTHITQDVVRAMQALPGCSCTMSFA